MYKQGDAVGSAWILKFQPMRRLYVTGKRETSAGQASFCTRHMAEHIWELVQARPQPLAETLSR